jgi:hypothetical protein
MRRGDGRAASGPSDRGGEPISPAGRIAGFTTAGCFLLAGASFTIVALTVVLCRAGCPVEPPLGGLALFLSVPPCAAGVAIAPSPRAASR